MFALIWHEISGIAPRINMKGGNISDSSEKRRRRMAT